MCRGFSIEQPQCRWFDGQMCGIDMPDIWRQCIGQQNCQVYLEELKEKNKMAGTIVIDGVGQDAEIVVNERGGKQSKSPMAMHLVDPQFLNDWFNTGVPNYPLYDPVIAAITNFMGTGIKTELIEAVFECNSKLHFDDDENLAIVEIAKVLQYGADKYEANNWRLIPQEEHINHALIHYIAFLLGDTQDEHLEHCMCRLMMAYATKKSPEFSYTEYVPKGINRVHN